MGGTKPAVKKGMPHENEDGSEVCLFIYSIYKSLVYCSGLWFSLVLWCLV